MKKLILAACALTCAASVFAQGTVVFNNRVTGTIVTHVYSGGATPDVAVSGNGSTDTPAGATSWAGYTALAGATYSAQLYAAPGTVTDATSLVGAQPVTTFRTGAAAGFVSGVTATLTGVAGDSPVATLQMRVWDNTTGATWEAATVRGASPLFQVNAIGGTLNPAPALTGLQSFNITGTSTVPEPSTFALIGLGAAALLIFRRK